MRIFCISSLLTVLLSTSGVSAQKYIIREGESKAEIVIAENPPRMVAMAALELQYYLEKISGARLPVVTSPRSNNSIKIYVGKSPSTEKLGVTGEGLRYGAFRMVSGTGWLVLLGNDFDYNPESVEPWARNRNDRSRALADWDKITMESAGRKWRHPFGSTFKRWWNPVDYKSIMAERYGSDNQNIWDPRNLTWSGEYQGPGAGAGFWLQDEGGSFNAVCEFLESLGARWYMPGQTGEVIPCMESISLPAVNKTVHPDFALRYWFLPNYYGSSFADVMWGRHSGMNSLYEMLGNMAYAHGLTMVHGRTEMKVAHPEYYALIDGVRDTSHRGTGRACYSSEGLMDETVRFARFMFDQNDQPHISIWPGDAYIQCQCDLCKGKSASELVWSFVDKVARELYQSHPDRMVSCGAYTPYTSPPETVDKFTPNVAVIIAGAPRPGFSDPQRWQAYWEDVEAWRAKVSPDHIIRNRNNLYNMKWGYRGYDREKNIRVPIGFPVIFPHNMAKDLRALKGISMGDVCEVSRTHNEWYTPGVDHIAYYVQSRFLWDAGQDIDSLLNEYYTLFYGPAADEMKAAFEYSEANFEYAEHNFWCFTQGPWRRNHCSENMDLSVRNQMLELLQTARETAGETKYGERIDLVINVLN